MTFGKPFIFIQHKFEHKRIEVCRIWEICIFLSKNCLRPRDFNQKYYVTVILPQTKSFPQNALISTLKLLTVFFPTFPSYEFIKKDANFSFGTNFKTCCCRYETFSIKFLSSPNIHIVICVNFCEKYFNICTQSVWTTHISYFHIWDSIQNIWLRISENWSMWIKFGWKEEVLEFPCLWFPTILHSKIHIW